MVSTSGKSLKLKVGRLVALAWLLRSDGSISADHFRIPDSPISVPCGPPSAYVTPRCPCGASAMDGSGFAFSACPPRPGGRLNYKRFGLVVHNSAVNRQRRRTWYLFFPTARTSSPLPPLPFTTSTMNNDQLQQLKIAAPLVAGASYLAWKQLSKSKHDLPLPPGPPGKLIIGNALDIPTVDQGQTYHAMSETYNSKLRFLFEYISQLIVDLRLSR
jgi:hypothetical protein